jgi:hypothetical protein
LAQIKDFTIVLVALLAFLVLLGNAIKAFKDWKKPHDDLNTWRRDVDRKLENDNKRLESLEGGIKVLCRGNLAMLSHLINGNSVEKMTQSQTEITNYLIER